MRRYLGMLAIVVVAVSVFALRDEMRPVSGSDQRRAGEALLRATLANAPIDPAVTPLPTLDNDDPTKSVIARVRFDSRTQAAVERTKVITRRAHSHIGDPPILRLRLKDADGNVVNQMNDWSPLWEHIVDDLDHRHVIKPSGSGSFIVPFSPDLSKMTINDIALNREVLTVDLEPPIREFCVANPADPDCLEADLSVDAISAAGPFFAVLGKPVTVEVSSTVSNLGPDGPVDSRVVQSLVAGTGVSVSPSTSSTTDTPLALTKPATLKRSYEVTCTEAGARNLDFTTAVSPKRASVVDPASANNQKTLRLSLDCAMPITINIQPGSARNPVNLSGSTTPVAALTTNAGEYGNPLAFDATTINPASLRFGSNTQLLLGKGSPEIHGATHKENSLELDERTRDGDLDVLLHFRPRKDSLALTDTKGCVFGRFTTSAGVFSFFGCDKATVIK